MEPPDLGPAGTGGSLADAVTGTRQVGFEDRLVDARVFDRERLPAGEGFDGPGIVEGPASTLVVRPGQHAAVDEYGSVVVEVDG